MSIYRSFGIEPIINASGGVTRLGGPPMLPAALEAFENASRETVPLEQLQAAASKRIAAVTGTEAGLVTSGAAAALTLGAAAILCGDDPGRMERLPHCDGFPHEFVIAREQRNGYDHAVRASGARLVEVGFNEIVANAGVRRTELWEYEAAFGPNTAGAVYGFSSDSHPDLEELVKLAHRHDLPVLVDAAGELPPRGHLSAIAATGADLVAFSGGKAIRGPQATGILCGRRDLIASAALQMLDMDDHPELWDPPAEFIDRSRLRGMPRHGIGRGMKVSKEQIIALLTALDLFADGVDQAELETSRNWLESIANELGECPVRGEVITHHDGETHPHLELVLDASLSAFDVCRRLRNGRPPIYVGHGRLAENRLVIRTQSLSAEQCPLLARRLKEELRR